MALMMLVGTSSAWADHIQSTGSMCLKYWPGSGSDIWTSAIDLGKTLNLGDISGTPYIKAAWVKTQGGTSINYLKIVIYIDGVYKGDYGVNYSGNSSYWDRTFEGSFNIAFNTTPGEHTIEIKAEPNNATHGSTYVKYNVPGVVDPCATKCYVAGEIPGCNWGKNVQMTCDNGNWSKVFNDISAGTYKFKIIKGDSWIGNFDNNNGNVECKNVDNDNNIQFTTTSKGDITISFDGSKAWVTWEANCTKPDKPSIELSTNSICNGDNTQVTITVTGEAEKYQLYVSNNGYTKQGEPQTEKSFTVTPSKTTTYVVKALNGKCTSNYSNAVTLTVYAQPTVEQTKTAICKGEVINLNECVSKIPDNATLTWYSDDTRSAELSGDALNISLATETTYYYQASINDACTVDGSITLTVNELPENVDFGTNNTASVCQNASVNLTTLSAWTKDGQTIQWYSKDGDNYTPVDANQTITEGCTFYAKAIFSNTGCESLGYTSFYIKTLESPDAPTLQPITVCPQVGFDLTEKSGWTAPDDGSLNISWYEKSGEEYVAVNSAKLLNQGITQATTYYARVQNKETGCYSAYVSMSVSVATVSKLTITPATGTTTPWVSISYTVDTNETFEMSYPDGLTSLPNIEITQSNNGKTYTYKIPRPTDWGTGNASPARTSKTYTIQAMLTGSSAECPSIGTATVTLNDEANDKCTSTK
jgi:hypothetical protein